MNRIAFIASLTKGYDTVLDIGCDHGFVLKHALDNNYIKHGIASDINEGPLSHAKKNLAGYPVRFYLSAGFKSIKDDFDLAIITGMGPHLIIDILNDTKKHVGKTYILGANDKLEVLRSWLSNNGFNIIDEDIIYDDFYYVFIKVEKGHMVLNESDCYLGPKLKYKLDALPYYQHKLKHYQMLKHKAKGEKLNTIVQILSYFKEFLNS
jgi:tRNA (adenine22-N1)-methyltransferase